MLEGSTALRERVFRIISQLMDIPVEQVNEHSSPENLEKWDSFQHMNLILALEDEFKIRFTDEEIVEMGNVGAILAALQSRSVPA
jgi:acyl carrier protein